MCPKYLRLCAVRALRTFLLTVPFSAATVIAQGPAPETAPPLFPGGGLLSYSSAFTTHGAFPGLTPGVIVATSRPTLSHEADFNFTWGFHPDFDLTALIPIVTNGFDLLGRPRISGTGLGDAMLLVKYRFFRRDSSRGTNQASFTLGPKFPTGRTDLKSADGSLLPTGLQPGSGSTDVFVGANWTYTGLFNVRRLVADEDLHAVVRTEGTQATLLGSDLESRFWLSYRPYEAKDGAREWFIGPVLTWLHSGSDYFGEVKSPGSGGTVVLAGLTSYIGVHPGMHVWLGVDWDVTHSSGEMFMPVRRHFSFGITQQFRIPFLK